MKLENVQNLNSSSKRIYGDLFYMQTHYRIGEYFIGIIAGYLMYDLKISENIRASKVQKVLSAFGWLLSMGFTFTHVYLNPKSFLSQTSQNVYDAVSKELWVMSICWIIFACHHLKSGGVIRSFLSHQSWQPLSKMCLSIYLVHFIYIMMTMANFKRKLIVDTWWELHILIGDVAISIAIAAVFYIVVEAPVANITASMWNQTGRYSVNSRKPEGKTQEKIQV
jgi:peptidoglycan/LPS O-acetylase OafA/YrhL